jgi:hypothetical protein
MSSFVDAPERDSTVLGRRRGVEFPKILRRHLDAFPPLTRADSLGQAHFSTRGYFRSVQ